MVHGSLMLWSLWWDCLCVLLLGQGHVVSEPWSVFLGSLWDTLWGGGGFVFGF
ncbi:hypothetical protein KC19_7G049200 [Ceratodon purpureus]|uniref:Uncharacterized protein n=1 Tax=Ceratodon purpureus TaxID=3225 RepID=A0A8T0H2X4_CERPU|nr:hypothetical protein KC19_7G049200 [Ceratodon purpureus]